MTLPLPAGTYAIDTAHSQFCWAVRHLGISTIRGTFDRYAGSLVIGTTLESTSVDITVEMASVNSGNPGRDEHMHGSDWFDTAAHPTMTFRSTGVRAAGDTYEITGELAIKGTSREETLVVRYNGSSVFPMDGSTHVGFTVDGVISRSAYGVSFGVPLVSDAVEISLGAQFVQPRS